MEVPTTAIVNPSRTREILRRYDIRLTKRLGQHFLVDQNILKKEIEAAELTSRDTVLEVGPGIGTLTEALAGQAGRVVAIELDRKFVSILKDTLAPSQNVEVIQGDALRLDLKALTGGARFKLVSNLPYNVATPVIARVLEACPNLSLMVVMVGREIGERMTASPGQKAYGAFAVKLNYYAQVEQVALVSRHVFIPEPKVESTILRLTPRPRPPIAVDDRQAFFTFVDRLFQQRRKTLRHILGRGVALPPGIQPTVRAETLSLAQLALLYQAATHAPRP